VKWLRRIWEHLKNEHTQPHKLGLAVGVGLFLGCLPFYGLHLGICVAAAWLLKLNKATVYLAANISNPFVAPLIVAIGVALGELLRFGRWRGIDTAFGADFVETLSLWTGQIPDLFLSCLLGDAVLGAALGTVFGPLVWLWARRRSPTEGAGLAESTEEATTDTPQP